MPRAAGIEVDGKPVALISYKGDEGVVVLSAGPNRFRIDISDDQEKNGETLIRLVRYLRALAPILPPSQPSLVKGTVIPEIPDKDLPPIQKFTGVARATGAPKLQKATREDVLNILGSLKPPTTTTEEPQDASTETP